MGRAPCCEKIGLRRGRWTAEEDRILLNYIHLHGEGSWRSLPKNAGLLRCGKSCRLRWINYLRSDVKRGNISTEEEDTILKLHAKLGNRWSLIASHFSGRTDNEIKNYWNSHLSQKITASSTVKNKKPRKRKTTLRSPEKQSTINPSATAGGEVTHDSSDSRGQKETTKLIDFDPTVMLPATNHAKEDVTDNMINCSSSLSTNDSGQVNEVEEDDMMMTWPWEMSSTEEVGVDVDVQKQDAMIAWLLS
ncbi:hypothetical protein QVD17_16963 [Tagetes erecta]|uniref:Uncharacterized protein n=1 Tax=Tagetes erecta TaxID=13708 RepID=A0AAD8KRH4_TARER|nr:hypothetical protein QVD17_16963 [Tagetes erecta]